MIEASLCAYRCALVVIVVVVVVVAIVNGVLVSLLGIVSYF